MNSYWGASHGARDPDPVQSFSVDHFASKRPWSGSELRAVLRNHMDLDLRSGSRWSGFSARVERPIVCNKLFGI